MKKQHIGFALFAMLCIVLSFAFSSSNEGGFKAGSSTTSNSVVFIPTATSDTLTNAENDTITLSSLLSSKWTHCVQLSTTSLSGTRSAKVYIQETNTRAGGDWITVDSTSAVSASVAVVRKTGETYGLRHRYIVDATGTQSTKYTLQAVYKKY